MGSVAGIRAGRVFVELFADDSRLIRGLRTAAARLKAWGSAMSQHGQTLIFRSLAAATPVGFATKTFMGFEDQMKAVAAVTGATGRQFDLLYEKAKLLGRTTSFSAAEVAAGMLNLARAGFAPQEIDAAIAGMLDLARATGTELAMASDIAAGTLRAFGLEVSESTRVADILVATANSSAQTLEDLGEAMKYVAPIAEEYGLTLEETAKAVGVLANVQIKGSMAGTSLRQALLQLADPEVQRQIEALGVRVKDATGNLRSDFGTMLLEFGRAVSGMSNAEKLAVFKNLFDQRAAAAMAKLAKSEFPALAEAIDNAAGTAARTAKVMDSGLGGAFRRLWSAVEGVQIAIGEALGPVLNRVGDWMSGVAESISAWINANRGTVVAIVGLIAATMGAGVALFVFGRVLSGVGFVLTWVATGLVWFGKALALAASALSFLFSPLGLVAVAILALWQSLAVVAGGIGGAAKSIAAAIANVAVVAFGWLATAAGWATDAFWWLLDVAKNALGGLAGLFGKIPATAMWAFGQLRAGAAWAWNAIKGAVGGVVSWIGQGLASMRDGATAVWREISSVAVASWQGIKDALASGDLGLAARIAWAALKMEWQKLTAWLSERWAAVQENIQFVAVESTYELAGRLTKAYAWVRSMWATMLAAMKKAFVHFVWGIKTAWGSVQNWLAKKVAWVMSWFDSSIDAEATARMLDEEYERQQRQQDESAKQELRNIDAARDEWQKAIEEEKQGALAALEEERLRKHAERQQQSDADLKAAEEEVAKAKREWEAALQEATARRAAAESPDGTPSAGAKGRGGAGGPPPDPGAAERRMSVVGTFNAMAAWGLGAGGPLERVAKATEETARNTKKLVKQTDHAGLVFAP